MFHPKKASAALLTKTERMIHKNAQLSMGNMHEKTVLDKILQCKVIQIWVWVIRRECGNRIWTGRVNGL
jgi:hypothetical protein